MLFQLGIVILLFKVDVIFVFIYGNFNISL